MSRVGRTVAALALLSALGGCASWLPSSRLPGATGDASGLPSRPVYQLDIQAPDDLRPLLRNYLDLARFQNVTEADAITPSELDRLVAAAPAQVRALLETEGYFDATTTVERDTRGAGLPQVLLRVTPGLQARVTDWTLHVQGELRRRLDADDATSHTTLELIEKRWPLARGAPFRQSAWDESKTQSLARLRADGYPAANWLATEARVDASTGSVAIDGTLDSGPLYHLGELRIEGIDRYSVTTVYNLAPFATGQPYSEKLLLDFQERLRTANLFQSVSVELDPDPATANAAPVLVRLRELPLQEATLGAGFSDRTGQRISVEHRHRRVFGREFFGNYWGARNKLQLGRDEQSWEGDLTSHPLRGGYRHLLAGAVSRLESAGSVENASRLRIGRSLESERIDRLIFAEALLSTTRNDNGTVNSQSLSGNYQWIWRNVDSVLLPTEGLTANAQVALGVADSQATGRGPFSRGYTRLTQYTPLGNNWHATGRLEVGHVFVRNGTGLPDPLLFRAGGDDSVRGYDLRSLGPKVNGVTVSGRTLLTGSAELAHPWPGRPEIWLAGFVDAGDAADTWSELSPSVGLGVGLRYRSPVGPLRLDLAYGEAVRAFRLHFSVGISF